MNHEMPEQLSSMKLYQTHFLERIIIGLGIAGLFGSLASLAIASMIGFSLVSILPTLLIFQIIYTLIFRKKLNRKMFAGGLIALLLAMSYLTSYGIDLLNVSVAFALLSSIIGTIIWGFRVGGTLGVLYLIYLGFIIYSQFSGNMTTQMDLAGYERTLEGCLSYGSIAIVISMLLFLIFTEYQTNLRRLNEAIISHQDKLRYLANHDPLTGLPTVRLTNEHMTLAIEQSKRSKHKTALLFLELHGVEGVVDRLGESAGDEMIKIIAARVRRAIRSTDTTCRIGGNEFMILIAKAENRGEIDVVCTRLFDIVAKPINLEGESLDISITVGGALYPDHAPDAAGLRKRADEIMYEVKHSDNASLLIAPD